MQTDFWEVYDHEDFALVHIDTDNDTPENLHAHWDQFNPTFPVLVSCASLYSQYGDGFIPYDVILDRDGIVRYTESGYYPSDLHDVIQEYIALGYLALYYDQHEILADTDGDGVAEPGETVELAVDLEYTGDTPLTGVSAALQEDSEWIDILAGTSNYPDFNPGEIHRNLTPFSLLVDPAAPEVFEVELRLELQSGESTAQVLFTFQVGQRAVYWSEDCEGDLSGWNHYNAPGWGDDWHLSTEDSQSPTHSWKCGDTGTGNYANHLDSFLESPAVDLRPYSRLRMMQRIDAEISDFYPDSAYDGGVVELSADDGQSWEQIFAVSGGYNRNFRWESGGGNPASHPFDGGTFCYSGNLGWHEAIFDLGSYGEERVAFRFRFGSDNGTADEGWYLDDFLLEGLAEVSLDPVTDLSISYTGSSEVLLEWSAVAGAGSYRIETAEYLGDAWSTLGTTTETTWTEPTANGAMLFRVIAVE